MAVIFWLGALALIGFGIWRLIRGSVVAGVALICAGLLVGPGGLGVFT